MRKEVKIISTIIIILIILIVSNYKEKMLEKFSTRKENNELRIAEVQIIDRYNRLQELYDDPRLEQYVPVDIIIDGQYYTYVGIRTKGSVIYNILETFRFDNYSFKVKLDYIHEEQKYNGMNELHLNTTFYDKTGMKEYLIYDMYNQMGIETQQYCFGHLKIGDTDRGLITITEVINENYVQHKYNSKKGNLYKPIKGEDSEIFGADLKYKSPNKEDYKEILENVKTSQTTEQDKDRLINIIKNINESSETSIIEDNFMDFDKIIKMIAINKIVTSLDVFSGKPLRNYYIYEENGKIDILTFDYDLSFNPDYNKAFITENLDELDLEKCDIETYSRIVDIIIENEEYNKKYFQYIDEVQQMLKDTEIYELIDEIYIKTKDIIKGNEKKIHEYDVYEENVIMLKEFLVKRGNL